MGLLQLLIYGGAVNNFSGYHMIPVTQALEITRTEFTLANSVRSIMGVFSTLFSGILIQKYGYRKVAAVGMALAGLSYVFYTTMSAYWMLIAGSAIIGLANGVCATAGVSRLLNGWFHKYRGTVLGVVTAATGVGSTLLGFVQTWAIEKISWRLSFGIVAGLQLVLAVVIYLLVRNDPKDMGLRPYGEGEVSVDKKKPKVARWMGPSMQQLKKRPSFYWMLGCAFLSCLCVLATQYNLVPYLQDCDMSPTRTGNIYGTMMLFLGVIKLGMGALCDLIGPKKVVLICHTACAAGLVLVMKLPQTDMAMIGALLVYDFSIPLTTMMFPLLSVDLFGYRAQSQYIGTIMAMTSASNIISGPLANLVRDRVGTYEPAFWAVAALSVGMIAMYLLLFVFSEKDKVKFSQEQ